MGGIFNYAVEMGSGAMIYVPSFINIGSGVKNGGYIDTHTDSNVIS
jgi:tetrahydrodipicolinate N-succinyltransferase